MRYEMKIKYDIQMQGFFSQNATVLVKPNRFCTDFRFQLQHKLENLFACGFISERNKSIKFRTMLKN